MAVEINIKDKKSDKIAVLAGVLARLASSDTPLGSAELGKEFSKSKVYMYRLLKSLEAIGWVYKDPVSKKYKVGTELVGFGLLLFSQLLILKISLPYLYELYDIANETTALCIRVGFQRLFVQQIPAKHDNHHNVILGQFFPLWLGASGKSMVAFLNEKEINKIIDIMRRELPFYNTNLSFNTDQYRQNLKEIKQRGYAISVGDYRPDVCVLAAPIFDPKNAVVGSLIVRGRTPNFNAKRAEKYSPVLIELTNKITKDLKNNT